MKDFAPLSTPRAGHDGSPIVVAGKGKKAGKKKTAGKAKGSAQAAPAASKPSTSKPAKPTDAAACSALTVHNLTDKVLELYPDMEGAGTIPGLIFVLTQGPITHGCCVVLAAWTQPSKQVAMTDHRDWSL